MREQAYAVALRAIEGVGAARLRRLREAFGSLSEAWQASATALAAVPGLGPETAQAIAAQRTTLDPERELERLERAGVRLTCCWEDDYPEPLRHLADAPAVLFYRGTLPPLERSVAIVGTRRASMYGTRVARDLARDLARRGVVVVSGLALGIDTAAHVGAVEGGLTLAVLGSGLDHLHPPSNRALAERIAARGAVITEYPLGTEPSPGQFPARNRIVAALARAVVVVEARQKSGAMITVDFALELGREVGAVPGPIDAPTSAGPHQLIQQGAKLVARAQDLMSELEWGTEAEPAPAMPPDDPQEARVWEAIGSEATSLEAIGLSCGLGVAEVNSVLLVLELKGRVQQLPGRLYRRS